MMLSSDSLETGTGSSNSLPSASESLMLRKLARPGLERHHPLRRSI
jgi:hypothetical protein